MREKLVFYFPHPTGGGVAVLFLRLAAALQSTHDVYLVDRPDGYMGRRVPSGVTLIDVNAGAEFPPDAVLVAQSLRPWNLAAVDRMSDRMRVLFWNLHPYNLYPHLFSDFIGSPRKRQIGRALRPLSALRRRKLARSIEYLSDNGGLVFMDEENRNQTREFFPGVALPETYVPVLADGGTRRAAGSATGVLRCVWVGRLVDFKATILAHVMRRLDAAAAVIGPVALKVIGDGEARAMLEETGRTLDALDVSFVGDVPIEQLGGALTRDTDVAFAMGTSALDAAARGIPTILLDYSFTPIDGLYRFRPIEEARGFNLGERITPSHLEPTSSLEALLTRIQDDPGAAGERAFTYWKHHHSPDFVIDRFLDAARSTRATIGHLRALGAFTPDPITRVVLGGWNAAQSAPRIDGFGNL